MTDLSIIIPCRDEEENVNTIYENIIKKIKTENYQIIFINDFSSDNTENKIKKLSSNDKKIFLYNNAKKGLGGAIDLGLKKSMGKFITILMADSADSIDDLNNYIKKTYCPLSLNSDAFLRLVRTIKFSTPAKHGGDYLLYLFATHQLNANHFEFEESLNYHMTQSLHQAILEPHI